MSASRANSLNSSDWLKNSFSIWRGLSRDTDVANRPALYNRMRLRGAPYKFIVDNMHEYLLVFGKSEERHGRETESDG